MFLPLFFGQQFLDYNLLSYCFGAFVSFSLMASAVYIFNDLQDRQFDILHPIKKNRPIAGGQISIKEGYILFALLVSLSLTLGVLLHLYLAFVLALYLLINIGYTKVLKHIIIIDILCIASGFLLRLKAGALVTDIVLSYWIIGLTFLLSLFLALGKRREDVIAYKKSGAIYRKTAAHYSIKLIDTLIVLVIVSLVVGYIFYTFSSVVITQMGSSLLFTTSLWVIIGLGRYLYLIFRKNKGGSPTNILVTDIWLQLTILAWILNFFVLIY